MWKLKFSLCDQMPDDSCLDKISSAPKMISKELSFSNAGIITRNKLIDQIHYQMKKSPVIIKLINQTQGVFSYSVILHLTGKVEDVEYCISQIKG